MNPTFKSLDGSQNKIKYETSFVNCNNAIYLDETSFLLEILLINMDSCKLKVFSQKKKQEQTLIAIIIGFIHITGNFDFLIV